MNLAILKQELQQGLRNILQYWMQHAVDEQQGSFWKCPYHNGRARIELIKRLSEA